jgi:MFS family permease
MTLAGLRVPRLNINQGVPEQYKKTFLYLYLDIAWYGVLNGSILTFITVYAARIGATAEQVGYLSAIPAVVAIFLAIPSGSWLQKGESNFRVVLSSIAHRFFYILLIFIPFLGSKSLQVDIIIYMILVMSLPGTALQVGFNNLFAETVPPAWRGHVAGARNALFSLISILVLLLCGQILRLVIFPLNYQIVFSLGFIGAMLSSLYLWLASKSHAANVLSPLAPLTREDGPEEIPVNGKFAQLALPGFKENTGFYRAMGVLFFLNLAIYLASPVFPIYWVNHLHLTDQVISVGNGLFFVTNFIGSTQLSRLAGKYGNRYVIGAGALLMAFYPTLLGLSTGPALYYVTSLGGGLASSLVGGLLINYLLEQTPEKRRPQYLAVYSIFLYAAVLIGSLVGPAIGTWIGLQTAMFVFAAIRLLAGISVLALR